MVRAMAFPIQHGFADQHPSASNDVPVLPQQDTGGRAHTRGYAAGSINNEGRRDAKPQEQATLAGTIHPPDRAADRAGGHSVTNGTLAGGAPELRFLEHLPRLPGLTAREAALVNVAVLLRIVGYDHLRTSLFKGQNAAAVRKAARVLEERGWVQRWNASISKVGRIGHVHPTARALNSVLDAIGSSIAAEPWARVVALMLPLSGRRPLTLGQAVPKWFPHQREINSLIMSTLCAPESRTLWASSWECPFPERVGMFAMPQPDYVLVQSGAAGPYLIFGEHDRGTEPVERFVARKVALYSGLAAFPDACAEMFGVSRFAVHVSVLDARKRMPIARLRDLLDATLAFGAPPIFRFTLAGWHCAYPREPIWFTADGPPQHGSVRWLEHAGLCDAS